MPNIFPYFDKHPAIDSTAFVAPTAAIIGDVTIGAHSEIWAGSPAKFFRQLTQSEQDWITISADNYAKHAAEYLYHFPN